ncbi:MAG: HAD-IA family hydrolase, partial [Chloroflexi bacterium]|nr:HAD-IA family hydrolase [Chloroflexota bacterium]
AIYVDYVEADGDHMWFCPQDLDEIVPGSSDINSPAVIDLVCQLDASGFSQPAALELIAGKWRSVEMDGRRVGAAAELLELGIADLFSAIVGLEDVTRFKPDPEPVEVALRRLSVAPQEAVMVGDSPADIEAGRAAGCLTCHATWGLPAADRSSADLGADMVAETPEAILRLLFA